MIRCKENHPTPKLSPEEVDAIAEIKDSIKDRANAFSEMEAFLPKKNGFDSVIFRFIVYLDQRGSFKLKKNVKLLKVVELANKVCLYNKPIKMFKISIVSDWHLFLFRLYLTLVLGNVNVTLLNKQSK